MENLKINNNILNKNNYIPISKIENPKKKKKYSLKINIFVISLFLLILFFIINNNDIIDNYSKISKKPIKENEINDEFIKNIKIIFKGDEIIENAMMNKYTTFKIGGPAKYLVKPKRIKLIILY